MKFDDFSLDLFRCVIFRNRYVFVYNAVLDLDLSPNQLVPATGEVFSAGSVVLAPGPVDKLGISGITGLGCTSPAFTSDLVVKCETWPGMSARFSNRLVISRVVAALSTFQCETSSERAPA